MTVKRLLVLLTLFVLKLVAQPDNDSFANRLRISGNRIALIPSLLNATVEPGEPGAATNTATAWYSWSAPADGMLRVPAGMRVFTGTSLPTLSELPAETLTTNASLIGGLDQFRFLRVRSTETYAIQFTGLSSSGGGSLFQGSTINIAFDPPSAHDSASSPLVIPTAGGVITPPLLLTSAEAGEIGSYPASEVRGSTWYEWTCPRDGMLATYFETLGNPPNRFRSLEILPKEIEGRTHPFTSFPLNYAYARRGPVTEWSRSWQGSAQPVYGGWTYRIRIVAGVTEELWRCRLLYCDARWDTISNRVEYRPGETPEARLIFGEYPARSEIRLLHSFGPRSGGLVSPFAGSFRPSGQFGISSFPEVWTAMLSETVDDMRYVLPPLSLIKLPVASELSGTEINDASSQSVHSWVAPASGTVILDRNRRLYDGIPDEGGWEVSPVLTESYLQSASVMAGRRYWLIGTNNTPLTLRFYPGPRRDSPESAEPITGARFDIATYPLLGAATETNFIDGVAVLARPAVWYRWTAPAAGVLRITDNFSKSEVLALSAGDLAAHRDISPPRRVSASETYYLRIRSTSNIPEASIQFRLFSTPNVGPGVAEPLSGDFGRRLVNFNMAAPPAGDSDPGGAWFRFDVPTNGVFAAVGDSGIGVEVFRQPQSGGLQLPAAVVSGETLYLRVQGTPATYNADKGFAWYFTSTPTNDFFAYRTILTGNAGTNVALCLTASGEEAEPADPGGPANETLWWSWTAPADGTLSWLGPVQVFAGDHVDALTRVSSNEIQVAAGDEYQFRVHRWSMPVTWTYAFFATATNSTLANGIRILPDGGRFPIRTGRIAADPAVPNSAPGLWWSWTAPETASVWLHTETSLASMLVYRAIPGGGLISQPIADGGGFSVGQSPARIEVEKGTEYVIIAIPTYGFGDLGYFQLRSGAPANDRFANADVLPSGDTIFSGSSVAATREQGEPAHGVFDSGRTVWFSWTASESGETELVFAPGFANAAVAIYSGNTLESLEKLASGILSRPSSGIPFTATLRFVAQAGVAYRMAVDGEYRAAGVFSGSIRHVAPARIWFAGPLFAPSGVLTGRVIEVRDVPEGASPEFSYDLQNWWTDPAMIPRLDFSTGENYWSVPAEPPVRFIRASW